MLLLLKTSIAWRTFAADYGQVWRWADQAEAQRLIAHGAARALTENDPVVTSLAARGDYIRDLAEHLAEQERRDNMERGYAVARKLAQLSAQEEIEAKELAEIEAQLEAQRLRQAAAPPPEETVEIPATLPLFTPSVFPQVGAM